MKTIVFLPDKIYNIPYGPVRKIKNLDDWGDKETVYMKVSKFGANAFSSNDKFGIYFGIINGKFCVGRYNKIENFIDVLECFETLSELKHNWVPD